MVQKKLKRNIKSIGFIIVIYFSIVKIAKNTKTTKKYSSLGTAIQKYIRKNLGDHIHLVF